MLAALRAHARHDGVLVAIAFFVRWIAQRLVPAAIRARLRGRDPGEAAAARYLRATGHRVLARNWRSPRDPRDEADLVVVTPDRETVVLVEVKRAAGDWDPLERVDARKRAVLWRLVGDLARLAESNCDSEPRPHGLEEAHASSTAGAPDGHRGASPPLVRWSDRRLLGPLRRARAIRTDLIAVRGSGSGATVSRHLTALHEVRVHEVWGHEVWGHEIRVHDGAPAGLRALPPSSRAVPRAATRAPP